MCVLVLSPVLAMIVASTGESVNLPALGGTIMSKKIVVITGSPRKNGNSFAMTDSFIRAAEEKGHTITRFDAAMMKIGGCHACETCFKTGKACSFDDDFNIIAPAILDADVIVFTMPVYWYSIPAQIKGVIDRMYSLVVGGKDIAGKACALIACCEEDDLSVLDGVRIPVERTAALNKWKMVGEVLIKERGWKTIIVIDVLRLLHSLVGRKCMIS